MTLEELKSLCRHVTVWRENWSDDPRLILAWERLDAIRQLLEPGCDEVDIAKAREILAL